VTLSKLAKQWLKDNDPRYGKRKKEKLPGDPLSTQEIRGRRMKKIVSASAAKRWRCEKDRQSIRAFVEEHRNWKGSGCRFVPGAQPYREARVDFCGKSIAAARYMLLLTQGTPKSEGMWARHKCGNGHLSCVNPAHLEWGTPGDNIGDANIHRAMECATVEDKCRAVDARTSK
jgi:hypothetical protein